MKPNDEKTIPGPSKIARSSSSLSGRTSLTGRNTKSSPLPRSLGKNAGEIQHRLLGMDSLGHAVIGELSDGSVVYLNASATDLLGYESTDLAGRSFKTILPPECHEEYDRLLERSNQGEVISNLETACLHKDGRRLEVSISISPLRDEQGKIMGTSRTLRDIGDWQQARRRLSLMESCVSTLTDLVVIFDPASSDAAGPQVIYANEALERFTGYPLSELLGRGPHFLATERTDAAALAEIWETLKRNEPVRRQISHRTKDGRDAALELEISPIFDATNRCTHYIGIFRDITELTRINSLNEEQAELLDRTQDAVVVHDLEGKVLFWNKGAERIYGWTRQETVGRHVGDHLYIDPKNFREANAITLEKGEWSGDVRHLSKDNREIVLESRWSLLREKDGRPKSVLGIKTDVTEKRKLELQFIRAQRMASLGLLAGGVAHDLNNILTPIMLSIDMLKSMMKEPQAGPVLETIEMSVRRGSDIVQQVLSFARGMEGQRIIIQPRYLLQEIENIVKDTFPKNIRLKFFLPHDTWTVIGDPTQVQQVLLNLCVNARDAMPDGGTLSIDAKNCVIDEHYAGPGSQAKAGMYVAISVTDAGSGIPEEIIDKIFEPFFTTKEVGKGTGLGLSSVQAIVKSHDGFIDVHSEPNRGTTFKIYLPAQAAASDVLESALDRASAPRGSGETILVVDDEASILSVAQHTLETFGYKLLTAGNGAVAVALYAQNLDKISAILTDLSMPIMDGRATIYALLKINPQAKIIAMSGVDESRSAIMAANVGIKHFISKPYTAGSLLKALHAVIHDQVVS